MSYIARRAFNLADAGANPAHYDICVFGATSAGIAAAVQARRMGRTVVIVEPGKYIGGLTTGGLGATDIGNKTAVGGISREFYHRVALHYSQTNAWIWEKRGDYFAHRGSGQSAASDLDAAESTMWITQNYGHDCWLIGSIWIGNGSDHRRATSFTAFAYEFAIHVVLG